MGFGQPSVFKATIVKYATVHSSLEPSIESSLLTSIPTRTRKLVHSTPATSAAMFLCLSALVTP